MARRAIIWAAAGIMILGILARFGRLDFEGLWCDEGYTAAIIEMPYGEMLRTLTQTDDAPPFYYLLQKLLAPLTGTSETGLRALPALCGCLALLVLLLRNGSRRWAAEGWSAGFFALAAYAIYYARQARSYALLMLFALLLILSVRDLLLRGPRAARSATVIFVISAVLICATHHIGVLLIMTSLPLWFLRRASDLSLRRWLLLHALPFAAWGLLWSASRAQLNLHDIFNLWIARFWQDHPLVLAPLFSLEAFLPGALPAAHRGISFPTLPETSQLWPLLSALLALLAFAALVCGERCGRWLKSSPPEPHEGRAALIEGAFIVLPLGALTAAALITTPAYVVARTDAIAFPAFALLIGRGLQRLPRWFAASALLFWGILSFATLAPSYGIGSAGWVKGADRELARTIASAGLERDDWLIHGFLTSPSLEYYLARDGAAHQATHFPAVAGVNVAAIGPTPPDSLASYLAEAEELRRRIEAAAAAETDVWILALQAPVHAATGRRIQAGQATLTAEEVSYPTNLLLYAFIGKEAAQVVAHYRQDGMGGARVALRVPREQWIPPDELPPLLTGEAGR